MTEEARLRRKGRKAVTQTNSALPVQESEQLSTLVADTAPVLIWMSGTDGLCVYFNKTWLAFTGRSLDQELGNGWSKGVHPDDLEHCMSTYLQAFDQRQSFRMEYRLRRHDAEYRWVLDIGVPRFSQSGVFEGYSGIAVDVTDRKITERELALANERLELSMEAGRIGGWDVDIESGRRFWFGRTHELMAFPGDYKPDMDGAWERVHPEDRERLRNALEYAKLNQNRFEEEFRVQSPDGSTRWLRSQGQYFYAPNGKPKRMLGVSVDITNRKRAEEKLAEREQRLQLAIKAGKMFAYDWDVASDKMIRSGEYRDVLGYEPPPTRTELLPRVHPDDVHLFNEAAQRTPESPDVQVTYRLLRLDGSLSWIENTGRAYFDESGRMVRMVGMIADVTERKVAEEARSRHAAIVECSEDSIISQNLDGTITSWNPGAQKIFGYTEAEAIGQPITILIPAAQQEEEQRNQDAVLSGKRIEHFESTRLTKSGKTINVSLSISPLRDSSGQIVGVTRIARDITERKLAEEALASVTQKLIEIQEEERKRIARELHDDIGQRLVLLSIELHSLKEEEGIGAEVTSRLTSLSKDVSQISQAIQSVSHQLHSAQLEYLGIVAAMNSFCREFAERQSVAVAFTHGEIPKIVESDVSLSLFRVMQEALNNAAKHSNAREFEVNLGCSEDQLDLTISDRGVGFDTEAAAKKGRLGLVSMRERVRMVRGTISIDSKPMAGTTIHVKVPLSAKRVASA